MKIDDLEKVLSAAFPDGSVQILDPMNDGVHLGALIISSQFEGKNRIARHRLVYAALGDAFSGALHALQITTRTPEEQTQSS